MVSEFYGFNLETITNEHDIFLHVLKEKLPEFYKKLEESEITKEIFLFEWIITMYSSIFKPEFSFKLWDSIFYHGNYFILKIALAIFKCIATRSKDIDEEEDDL